MAPVMFPAGLQRAYVAPGCRYNSAGLQRERILDALQRAGEEGRTGAELAALCSVPCVTKRISELRRKGWQINSVPHVAAAADGSFNTVSMYVLSQAEPVQADLFPGA